MAFRHLWIENMNHKGAMNLKTKVFRKKGEKMTLNKEILMNIADAIRETEKDDTNVIITPDISDPGPCDESGFNILFVLSFVTAEMRKEMPAILKAYLQQRKGVLPGLSEYESVFGVNGAKTLLTLYEIERSLANRSIALMFYDWNQQNSPLAASFLLMLYRCFHKDEYKVFKKFPQIGMESLAAFQTKDEEAVANGIAIRLLAMGEVAGKPIDGKVKNIYLADNMKLLEKLGMVKMCEPTEADAVKWEKILNSNRAIKLSANITEFLTDIGVLYGCFIGGDVLPEDDVDGFTDAFCAFFRDTELSDEAIAAVFTAAQMIAYTSFEMRKGSDVMTGYLNTLLSDEPGTSDPAILKLFRTEEKAPAEASAEDTGKIGELESELATLKAENDTLKKQLKAEKGESEWLSRMVSDLKAEIKSLKKNTPAGPQKKEDAIRNDTAPAPAPEEPDIPLSEMRGVIADMNIVIVGGHDNWLVKIRDIFPKWKLVGAAAKPNRGIVANADLIVFFTDHSSHLTYNGYCDIARNLRIPFGYIHGVNTNNNIKDIYSLAMGV